MDETIKNNRGSDINMDIEIAKEKLKAIDIKFFLSGITEQSNYIVDKADEINIAIETVLSELEKKDKQIDLMAEQLAGLAIFDIEKDEPLILGDKEEVKQYFEKKVEGK